MRWWELPVVAWLLALALVTAAPGEANLAAALVSGLLGSAVYGAVTRVFAP